MKDIVVIEQLRKRGCGLKDLQDTLHYEAIERLPRILDKAPKRLTIVKAKDIESYGCCSSFVIQYQQLKDGTNLEIATLDMKGAKRYCDTEVFLVLQTLIRLSMTKSKDLAGACLEMFKTIILIPGETLTKARVYDTLSTYSTTDYYTLELIKGIRITLFNEEAPVLYWISSCELTGFYVKAVELGRKVIKDNCTNEKEVRKFLQPLYKQAKEDKEFMKNIYINGANKWLVPMLYYLKDSNPEALDPGNNKEGFA